MNAVPPAAAPAQTGIQGAAAACHPEARSGEGSVPESSLTGFSDLLNLKPSAGAPAAAVAEESDETLPTPDDLTALMPLLGIPVGAPMGLALPPPISVPLLTQIPDPVPSGPAPRLTSVSLASTKPAPLSLPEQLIAPSPSLTAPAAAAPNPLADPADEGSEIQMTLPDLAALVLADATQGAEAPLAHVRIAAELVLPLTAKGDEATVAMAAAGLAPGPGPEKHTINVQPASAPPVTVPPSHPDWSQQVAASVAWSIKRESTDVEIKLHPPELGALRVLLKIDGHRVEASFTAPVAETRQALEQTLPRLRELLAGQGLSLMQAQVSDQQRHAAQSAPFMPQFADAPAEPEFTAPVIVRLRSPGLLDEYA